jgi:glycosyltransferase involved in cell wall biosynthesis
MRIVHLTPGTANFHCGSCLRDMDLVKALRSQGHDITLMPLYLPLVTDGAEEEELVSDLRAKETAGGKPSVFLGGINVYLQQVSRLFRFLPGFITRRLDSEKLLRKVAERASMTSPRTLGRMTVGSLEAADGKQAKEWRRIVEWIGEQSPRPDVVSLSNVLLIGVAKTIEEELGIPVVCSLQGEDSFLDTLPEPYRSRCWKILREKARHVTRFIAVSDYYAEIMRARLELDRDRVVRVWNGIAVERFPHRQAEPAELAVGYLARMCHGKGLHTLVRAFVEIHRRGRFPSLRLRIAGAKTAADERFIEGLKAELRAAGLEALTEWRPNVSFEEKIGFLHSLTILSVPAAYGESFGLFVIEALACGIPVVQPRHGGFPEIVGKSGGGILFDEPESPGALADALESLLDDPNLRKTLAASGRAAVEEHFAAERMAAAFAQACPLAEPASPPA